MATTVANRTRQRMQTLTDDDRAQVISDKMEVRARIDQLQRSLTKQYRRLDYLLRLAPDE